MPDLASDRDAIRQLLAVYTYNGDRGRIAELAACFALNGVLEFPGATATGPEAIAAALSGGGPGDPRRSFVRHHTTNPLIEVDGDSATSRSYFTVWSNHGADHAGTYSDRFERTPQGWRFTHRLVRIDWQAEESLFRRMVTR
ncbi:MAG: hypothetical protein RL339_1583 [Pseudomonadota bacterium]|jgi:hypothetical protein